MDLWYENHTSSQLKTCGGCGVLKYCGKECQTVDWKAFHKHGECDLFRSSSGKFVPVHPHLKGMFEDALAVQNAAITVRLDLLLKADPELMEKKFLCHDGTEKSFADVPAGSATAKTDLHEMNFESVVHLETAATTAAQTTCVRTAVIPMDDTDRWRSLNNMVRACGWPTTGTRVYVPLAFIQHSCRPNAVISFEKDKLIITAVSDIADAADVTIDKGKVAPLLKEERQERLAKMRGFICQCDRCQAGDLPGETAAADQPEEITDMPDLISQSSSQQQQPANGQGDEMGATGRSDVFTAREAYSFISYLETRIKREGVHPRLTEEMFNQAVMIMNFVPKCAKDKIVLKFLVEKLREMIPLTHGQYHPRVRVQTLEPMLRHKCWKKFESADDGR